MITSDISEKRLETLMVRVMTRTRAAAPEKLFECEPLYEGDAEELADEEPEYQQDQGQDKHDQNHGGTSTNTAMTMKAKTRKRRESISGTV